ncbi:MULTISPECIES: hypothetical protein [Clostridium]|uniref:hypothetical protein n=1 Tax=Clostridium TaxID=1485 RepID=UPI0008261D60|nr:MULTISPECIES: hypothetical protein [Clostridium]PJI08393.1 hypothetical protein CUB90_11210 [Clostridium sp. CT7]
MIKLDKKLILVVTTITVLMTILLVGYDLDQKKQLQVTQLHKSISFKNNKKNIQYSIDSININTAGNVGNIEGWAFIKGTNSFNIMPTIILKSEDGNLYKLTTIIVQRRDVTDFFNGIPHSDSVINSSSHLTCDTKNDIGQPHRIVYDNCGIISNFKISNLPKNKSYKIGIELTKGKSKYFIWTNRTFKL